MLRCFARALLIAWVAVSPLSAQGCDGNGFAGLDVPVATLGGTLTATLTAAPGAPFSWFVDTAPGNIPIPGIGSACIAMSPAMFALADGLFTGSSTIPGSGTLSSTVVLPSDPNLLGVPFYSQFAAGDAAAPGGIALSNPRSVVFNLPDNFVNSQGSLSTFGTALHRATPFGNGRYVLISGGGSGTLTAPTPGNQTEIYDSYTHTFLPGPPMSVARVLHTATLLQDGRILITGGLDGVATNNWMDGEVYDPATNTFTPVANQMQMPRGGHTATLLDDGRVLITGGNTIFAVAGTGNFIQIYQSAHRTVDIYDPATNTFVAGPNMLEKRAGHGAVKLPDGRVLCGGGISDGFTILLLAFPIYAGAGEIYDPATNSWSATGVHNYDRFVGNMEVTPSGNVLYCGGANGGLLSSTNTGDYYDAVSNTWTPIPFNMPADTALGSSVVLADGTVAVTGGGSGAAALFTAIDQVARFDETTFQWTTTTPLPIGLINHSVTLLPDGTYLVTGGADASGIAQTAAFLWNP